jgi:DNA-binding response OmpR family regulator
MENNGFYSGVWIVSSDQYFAQPLAEQLKNELGIVCSIASSFDDIKPQVPQLIITPDAATGQDEVPVLRLGTPPFRMHVLLDRVAALLNKQSSEDISIALDYCLQPRQKTLHYLPSHKQVSLTDKEVRLLQCLADANGRVVSKDQLLKIVWEMEVELDTHTLETHVYRLREKFRELSEHTMITAEAGGYKIEEKS